jgi:hypothetical protein
VKLDSNAERMLGDARIGMLAIHGERLPLVNPAAFHYSAGSIWLTTSRHAVKLALARRDPRAAFMVDAGGWGLLLSGRLESYDPRSISGQVRAALDGPRFYWGMAGYALKNAAFVGGYLVDLMDIPRDWWPHNRVVLRLRPQWARPLSSLAAPPAAPTTIPGIPTSVGRSLARVSRAYVCWYQNGWPVLAPGLWTVRDDGILSWLPPGSLSPPPGPVPAAVVVEAHHRYRSTRMLGACLRGRLRRSADGSAAVGDRYQVELGDGRAQELQPSRVTWWRGFHVNTTVLFRKRASGTEESRQATPP